MLWRTSTCRALWALDSYGSPRVGLGRPVFPALGISCRFHRAPAAGDSYVHCAARGNCADAARPFPHLHVSGIVALVSRACVVRYEVRRELARAWKVFAQVRCGDRSRAGGGRCVFYLEPLAESDWTANVSRWPSVNS